MVRSFKPIHWYSLYWSEGAGGVLVGVGGHSQAPQHPLSGGGSRDLEAEFGENCGLGVSAGVSPALRGWAGGGEVWDLGTRGAPKGTQRDPAPPRERRDGASRERAAELWVPTVPPVPAWPCRSLPGPVSPCLPFSGPTGPCLSL